VTDNRSKRDILGVLVLRTNPFRRYRSWRSAETWPRDATLEVLAGDQSRFELTFISSNKLRCVTDVTSLYARAASTTPQPTTIWPGGQAEQPLHGFWNWIPK
jgi:hypothetical protein